MDRVVLRKENRVVRQGQAILIENLDLVLVLVTESLLLMVHAKVQRFAVQFVMMGRPRCRTHVRLLIDYQAATTVTVAQIVG